MDLEENNSNIDILNNIKQQLDLLKKNNGKNKILNEILKSTNETEKKFKKNNNKKKQQENFKKLRDLCMPKNKNDFTYFRDVCSLEEQNKILVTLENINSINNIDKPYFIKLLESNMPDKFKAICLKKINSLRNNNPFSGENSKIKRMD